MRINIIEEIKKSKSKDTFHVPSVSVRQQRMEVMGLGVDLVNCISAGKVCRWVGFYCSANNDYLNVLRKGLSETNEFSMNFLLCVYIFAQNKTNICPSN